MRKFLSLSFCDALRLVPYEVAVNTLTIAVKTFLVIARLMNHLGIGDKEFVEDQ